MWSEEQVGLGDDAEHVALGVQHGRGADSLLGEPGDDLPERRPRLDGHHLGGHHVTYQALHGSSSLDSAPLDGFGWLSLARSPRGHLSIPSLVARSMK
jgi:hypothetical protein